jgi:hypothetical protein
MRLTIQNFDKVYSPLNVKLFDFGNWFIDDADIIEDAYCIIFQNKKTQRPYVEVTLNRNKVDGYGYQLETKIWYSGNNWESVDELFLEPFEIQTELGLLTIVESILKGIKC